jgi:hypothetical protein
MLAGEDTSSDQKGIARQEESEEESRFYKNDGANNDAHADGTEPID